MRAFTFVAFLAAVGCQAADPPHESQTDQESVVILPATFDFGQVQVGQQSAAHVVTISPGPGANDDVISSITMSCSDFANDSAGTLPAEVYRICDQTCSGGNQVAGAGPTPQIICPTFTTPQICQSSEVQDYSFATYFRPNVAGTSSCVVSISLNNGATVRTITLQGTGTPPPIHVSVQPASVNFGDVRVGTDSSNAGISVGNTGGATMTVSSVSVTGAGFSIVSGPTSAFTVAPNGTQPYAVACHPTSTGAMTGTFIVNSNDPGNPQVIVPLACKGVDSALAIQPSPAAIATTRVGEPVTASIQIVNSGGADSQIQSATVTGTGITMTSGPAAGTVLPANGGAATVQVSYDAASAGEVDGTLVVTYDGGQTRTSQITARALSTSMALTPDGDVDFGPVCVGQSKAQQFSVLANDQGGFLVSGISSPAAPFTVSAPALPAQVKGEGASTTSFTITAAPTDAGPATSSFVLTTDIPSSAPRTVNVTVTGLTAGVTPTPIALDLGSNPVNVTTIGQSVKVSNCNTDAVAWTNARIEGVDATDFAIVQEPESQSIPASGVASWLIVLQAHTVGNKSATFAVDYDGGTAMVDLTGEGLGDHPATGSLDPSSYYACSTGGAAGGAPIALVGFALVGLGRRRRRAS